MVGVLNDCERTSATIVSGTVPLNTIAACHRDVTPVFGLYNWEVCDAHQLYFEWSLDTGKSGQFDMDAPSGARHNLDLALSSPRRPVWLGARVQFATESASSIGEKRRDNAIGAVNLFLMRQMTGILVTPLVNLFCRELAPMILRWLLHGETNPQRLSHSSLTLATTSFRW